MPLRLEGKHFLNSAITGVMFEFMRLFPLLVLASVWLTLGCTSTDAKTRSKITSVASYEPFTVQITLLPVLVPPASRVDLQLVPNEFAYEHNEGWRYIPNSSITRPNDIFRTVLTYMGLQVQTTDSFTSAEVAGADYALFVATKKAFVQIIEIPKMPWYLDPESDDPPPGKVEAMVRVVFSIADVKTRKVVLTKESTATVHDAVSTPFGQPTFRRRAQLALLEPQLQVLRGMVIQAYYEVARDVGAELQRLSKEASGVRQ